MICWFVNTHQHFFLKQLDVSSRFNGHSLPRAGKKVNCFIWVSQSLSVRALQRRLSGTSSSVLTTAAYITYANTLYKRVVSLLRLFSLIESCSNNQTAALAVIIHTGSDWVLAVAASLTSLYSFQSGIVHTKLACVSCYYLICLICVSHGHGLEYVRYSIRRILILCGRIVRGPQCKMFLL